MKDKILNVIMGISILALIGAGYREYLIHNGKLTSDLNANGYSITNLPAGFFPAETDPTVPSWAKEDAPPSETDPTVPEWAKEPNKPTYGTNDIDGLSTALNGKLDKTGGTITGNVEVVGRFEVITPEMEDHITIRDIAGSPGIGVGNGLYEFPHKAGLQTFAVLSDIPSGQDITNAATWAAGNAYEDAVAVANAHTDASISETNEDFVAAVQAASPPVVLPQKWALANVTNANGGAVTAADVGAYPAASGVALESNIVSIGDDATNYTDSVAQELATSISQKYAKSSGDQLAQQVAAIGAHLNGEDARFVVTNYDSTVHTPEAYVEIKVSNAWLRVWDEGTRWNKYETWKTNVDAELSFKADRAWGVYDSETGGYSPAGFTQVSSSNILIAAGMAYQRTVTSSGSVWVLQCNSGVAQVSGDTNGFFRVKDSDGVTQFEIIKGDKREIGCDASGITVSPDTPPVVTVPYSVISSEHPSLYITERLETPVWKKEDDADCIANVVWGGSSGAWVATIHPKQNYASMFIRATYEVGGETYIRNNAPVEMPMLYLNGTKYYLGTAVINGHTVLTLSTTAP